MENNDYDKNTKGFLKWHRVYITTTIGTAFFTLIHALLNILEEFTDFEVTVPFFYSGIFVWIMVAFMLSFFTLMIISSFKTLKYRKLIEKSGNNKDVDVNEQNDSED